MNSGEPHPPHPGGPSPEARRSRQSAPDFRDEAHRAQQAAAFTAGAAQYEDARPSYPSVVTELLAPYHQILDVGAGTGKLTRQLAQCGHEVYALDPSAAMVNQLRRSWSSGGGLQPPSSPPPAWRATAERTGVRAASFDAVTCAQTWHWVDHSAACQEFERVLRPGGVALLAWNSIDTTEPWVLRLARIMHSGDVLRPGFVPPLGPGWLIERTVRSTWNQEITPEGIFALTQTRSYWLKAKLNIRARVRDNLHWYLFNKLGFEAGQKLLLPYRLDTFICRPKVAKETL